MFRKYGVVISTVRYRTSTQLPSNRAEEDSKAQPASQNNSIGDGLLLRTFAEVHRVVIEVNRAAKLFYLRVIAPGGPDLREMSGVLCSQLTESTLRIAQ